MRTPLVLLALALALAAPTAVALALPIGARIDMGVGDVGAVLETPANVPLGAIEGAAVAPRALSPVVSILAPLPEVDAPFSPPDAPSTMGDARASEPPAPPAAVQAAAATGILYLILERLGLGRAVAGAGALLYSRLAPNELLDHGRRERVVSLVRERPGIGPQEIGQALGMNWGVTSYHLDRLEGAGLLTSQRVGKARCYFVPGAMPREAQAQVGLFRGDTTRRVAQLVREKPGIGQSELAAALGLSASATSKQLSRLETAALVRREASGNGMRLFPQPGLDTALAPTLA